MNAKSLDLFVLLKLLLESSPKSYAQLASELGMSASEVHASVRRSGQAGLIGAHERSPNRRALQEYVLHGVQYAFPATRGPITRGMPTSFAAPPLVEKIQSNEAFVPVWPNAEGEARGYAIEPLYPSVPFAARRDQRLYELLALVDALREGRARERQLAEQELKNRLGYAHPA